MLKIWTKEDSRQLSIAIFLDIHARYTGPMYKAVNQSYDSVCKWQEIQSYIYENILEYTIRCAKRCE